MNNTKADDQKYGSKGGPNVDKDLSDTVAWCAAFSVIAIATVVANVFTIAVFGSKQIQRKRTHIFLINLSTADLMVGSIAVPLWVVMIYCQSANPGWRPSPVLSALYFTTDMLSGFASFFSIAVIALERLYSVSKPIKYRLLKSRGYFLAICLIWFGAGIVVLLKFVRFKIYTIYLNIVFLCLGLPLVVTVISYFKIFLKMRKRLRKAHRSQRNRIRENDDIRLAWTLILVTVVFFVTWTPFVVINAIYIYMCSAGACPITISKNVIYFTKLLHYGNSCINPVIYVVRIPTFHLAAVNTLKFGQRYFGKRSQCRNLGSRIEQDIPLKRLKRNGVNADPYLSTVVTRMSVSSSCVKSDENLNFGVHLEGTRL